MNNTVVVSLIAGIAGFFDLHFSVMQECEYI